MSNHRNSYRKAVSSLFLLIYISFLTIEVFHHHSYNFTNSENFALSSDRVHINNIDLINGNHSPCLLNSFSCTILNYYFPSLGILKPRTRYCVILSVEKKDFKSNLHLNNLTLRAPPAIS